MSEEIDDADSPAIQPYKPLYDTVLQRIYKGDAAALDKAIAKEAEDGGNELSVLRRLVSKVRTQETPGEVSITGYNLQTYRRGGGDGDNNRGFSTYVLTIDGIRTIHFDKKSDVVAPPKETNVSFGTPVTWHHIKQVHDLMNDTTFLGVHPGKTRFVPAKKEEIGRSIWQLARPLAEENIRDGFGIWRAYINGFSKVNKFGTDPPEQEAILGTGGEANLNVIVTAMPPPPTGRTDGGKFLKLTDEIQVRQLLGGLFNEQELMAEDGLRNMSQSLRATPVVIFGRGKTPNAKGVAPQYQVKSPKISLDGGLGRIVPVEE
jgi:hypothetical protein